MADELAKGANVRCRLEGIILFRHFLRGADDGITHKPVEASFAHCDRIGGCGGRCLGCLLREQNDRKSHPSGKERTESLIHANLLCLKLCDSPYPRFKQSRPGGYV